MKCPNCQHEFIPKKKINKAFDKDFDQIWIRYPMKQGKKEALRHFRATVRNIEAVKRIDIALDTYLAFLKKNPERPIQNGSTWFNNWEDWVDFVDPREALKKEEEKRILEKLENRKLAATLFKGDMGSDEDGKVDRTEIKEMLYHFKKRTWG